MRIEICCGCIKCLDFSTNKVFSRSIQTCVIKCSSNATHSSSVRFSNVLDNR